MDGTCCRLILLHRSELRSGSLPLGQTCSPEYQCPQKTTRKWFHAEDTRKAQLDCRKGGWESSTDASQQESTAEPRHCWAGSINRSANTPSREAQKGMKELEALLFNTHLVLKNRKSSVSTPQTVGCQLHFLEKVYKRLSGFSFWYQPHTRQTTR